MNCVNSVNTLDPLHKHTAVQSRAAFLHLQRPTQPFLHLHDTSSWQALEASGKVAQAVWFKQGNM